MGSCFSFDKVQPQKAVETLTTNGDAEFEGPIKGRSCTDVIWLVVFALFVISLFGLVAHCVVYGDLHRVLNGYDNCANVCGRMTPVEDDSRFACKGADMTSKKYLLIKEAGKALVNPRNVHKECVSDCNENPGYRKFLNRCIPEKSTKVVNNFFSKTGLQDFFLEVSEDLHLVWSQILYLCLIASGLSLVVLFLLQFVAGIVVWFVLIATVLVSVVGSIYLWIVWSSKNSEAQESDISKRVAKTYLVYAIIATIVTVIILLVILVMRKRIKLVVQLFEEAGKAVSSMPLLLFQPVVTFFALVMVMSLWVYLSLWIESSGHLYNGSPNYYYKKDATMKVTRWYNLLAMFWMVQFCIGCQHMIIAGSVATWFFTRNKDKLESPIGTSLSNLLRYHLGSVALGSFLIALLQLARAGLKALQSQVKEAKTDIGQAVFRACQCCLYCFEKFLTYLTRNAYIEIAIYGKNFFKSGEQAVKILAENSLRVIAINSVGDFVLFLSKVFVVSTVLLIGSIMIESVEGVQHMWVLLSLVGVFAYFVSHCFITVYEMVIDTIFICFCEDCEINDGINKPYFMSRGLMEFVQTSKKALAVGDSPSNTPATELQDSPSK